MSLRDKYNAAIQTAKGFRNANAYMKISEANRDQLTDPNRINPGRVLKLP